MCIGPLKPPSPPDPPPPPPSLPTPVDPAVISSRAANRQRAALASPRQGTLLTGPQGIVDDKKTLLGV